MQQLTQKEIASISGVSIATVSRYLSDPSSIREKTKRKIENALESYKKKILKTHSNMIAFVIPDIENPFFPMLLKGIESVSRTHGYTLMIYNSEGNPTNEERILGDLLDINVAGIILIHSGRTSPMLKDIVKNRKIPIVFLDRVPDMENINTVSSDNFDGMYQAVKYLTSLGHSRILYISGPKDLSTEKERLRGFKAALADSGTDTSGFSQINCEYSKTTAYEAIKQIISAGKFNYTAVCASNDLMMCGVYQALTEKGIRIPEDVSLIGYDDILISSLLNITTVRQPFEEMGKNAMLQLVSAIASPYMLKSNIILSTGLIIRNSCKMPPPFFIEITH